MALFLILLGLIGPYKLIPKKDILAPNKKAVCGVTSEI
jgi:hypothetical protein